MAAHNGARPLPVLVTLPAEIDVTNARDIRCQLSAAALKPGVTIVIADMTATTFCDNAGICALVLAHERAARNGAELRLLQPGHAVTRMLMLTGASRVLVTCDCLEEAMKA